MVDGNFGRLLAFRLKMRRPGRDEPMPSIPLSSRRASLPAQLGRALLLASLGALALVWSGCGNTLYAVQVNAASSKLEEAKELGAEQYAPYEYWFAYEHIEKAQVEASEADYSDAVKLAEIGEEYADKAIQLARDAHRGAGR
jgi:hypothetical protein